MCDPLSVGAGMLGVSMLSAVTPKIPQAMPTAPTAPPASQATKGPDVNAMRRANSASTGPSSTFLTGPEGVDPDELKIGRNTLLGT